MPLGQRIRRLTGEVVEGGYVCIAVDEYLELVWSQVVLVCDVVVCTYFLCVPSLRLHHEVAQLQAQAMRQREKLKQQSVYKEFLERVLEQSPEVS